MKRDMDKIVLESRREAELLQNAIEIAYASECCTDEEKKVSKELSALLEAIYLSW